MTMHRGRQTPHPILDSQIQNNPNRDYQETCLYNIPEQNQHVRLEDDSIQIYLHHQLQSPDLEARIAQAQAQYAVVVRCRTGHQRATYVSATPEQRILLTRAEYPGRLEFETYITAAQSFNNWKSPDWQPAVQEMLKAGINLEPGAFLARGPTFHCDTDQLQQAPSIITLVHSIEVDDRYRLDLSAEQIRIKVNSDLKSQINRLRNSPEFTDTLYTLWEKALIHAIARCEQEEYQDKAWSQALSKSLAQDPNLDPPLSADFAERQEQLQEHAYLYAQTLLQNPLNRFTAALRRFLEQEENDN